MRLRPACVYQNAAILLACLLVLYLLYSAFSYEDIDQLKHVKQKHFFITIDKERIDKRFKALAPKRILMWTHVFREQVRNELMAECPGLENRCVIDSDHSKASSSDAIVFHAPDLAETKDLPPPESRSAQQRYVFMTMESPPNTFSHAKEWPHLPKNYFNWTMTPLFNSDVIFKYGSFWLSAKEAELRGFKTTSFALDERQISNKKPAVFALISNCNPQSKREVALRELAKYVNVTIGGACASTEELKQICPKGKKCSEVFSEYAFVVAIENSACVDYVTEKYWERFDLPTVLIVMRRGDYAHMNMPTKSLIAMDDFASVKEMGEYLNKLVTDKRAYSEYFAWRSGGWRLAPWNSEGFRNGYCRLCERLWEKDSQETTIEDVGTWYSAESNCDKGEFVRDWIKTS